MVSVSGGNTASLRYDPLGRLYEVVGSSGTTRFFYDGDALVGEYDASGNLLRRYVHGTNMAADDPLAWYEGSGFAAANERFLRPNWQGSIVLVTDSTGQTIDVVNTYDEYGIPGANNTGRFQYTGQEWIPELGMYYYKARMYSPTLGRFMQTDPIGYKDQIDLYAYVANDPVDGTDPTGLAGCDSSVSKSDCGTLMKNQAKALADVRSIRSAIGRIEKGGKLSAGDAAVKSAISKVFGSTSNSTLRQVNSMLGKSEQVLADNGSNYNYHSPSAREVAASGVPGNAVAYTSFGSHTINVLPSYYAESNWHQEGTLIHEPTHIYGTVDNAYRIGPDAALTHGWSSYLPWHWNDGLNNADSYAAVIVGH